MIKNDIPILRKLFILLDYCKKIHKSLNDEEFIDTMYDKVSTLKIKLSFRYRNRDEKALRYLASKSKLTGLS